MLAKTLHRIIDKKFTTAKEVSELAGVSQSTVYRWIAGQSQPDFDSVRLLVRLLPDMRAQKALLTAFTAGTDWHATHMNLELDVNHDGKVDAPSGTAVSTVERMAAASNEWADDPTESETIDHARGAAGPAGIRVHSVRMRGMVAHQEVILGTAGQTLSVRHDSYDRSSFMPGVVLAAKRIADHPGLTVGLDSVLGI